MDDLLTYHQVIEQFQTTQPTISKKVKAGLLPVVVVDGKQRFSARDCAKIFQPRESESPGKALCEKTAKVDGGTKAVRGSMFNLPERENCAVYLLVMFTFQTTLNLIAQVGDWLQIPDEELAEIRDEYQDWLNEICFTLQSRANGDAMRRIFDNYMERK